MRISQFPAGWRRRVSVIAVLAGALCAPASMANPTPCNTTIATRNAGYERDMKRINNLLGQNLTMADNAKKCIDRVIQVADQIIAPKFPNLAKMSMDRIMSYLANKACKVAIKQAEGVVEDINGSLRPISDQLRAYENQVNTAIGQVGWSGGMADPAYNFNGYTSSGGPSTVTQPGGIPVPRDVPPPSRDPNCRLGFGNCR